MSTIKLAIISAVIGESFACMGLWLFRDSDAVLAVWAHFHFLGLFLINRCFDAGERFALLAAIPTGAAQFFVLAYGTIWKWRRWREHSSA